MSGLSSKDTLHHNLFGQDVFSSRNPKFIEYRRRWEDNPTKLEPGNFPLHIDIEVTNCCNLKCPFCATTYLDPKIKRGFIEFKLVKKILDEAGHNGLYACKFNFRGEPLLHNELGRIISYAKKKGVIDTFFNTNATLLNEEKAKMLIGSGLDRLTVSFEGFSRQTYERNRPGADFKKVISNIENLRNLRDKLGSAKPKIKVQAVLIPELEGRIDEFISFWKDRVDQVSYNEMLDNIPKNVKVIKSSWICPFHYQRIMVMWDGTITACYNDLYGKLALGNIHSSTIKDCWIYSLENLRKLHRNGQAHKIEVCARCPLRMNELKKRGEA